MITSGMVGDLDEGLNRLLFKMVGVTIAVVGVAYVLLRRPPRRLGGYKRRNRSRR